MNPMFSQAMPQGSLPPVPQNPIFGNQNLGSLPPIPGFNPSQLPPMNPMAGEHLFFQNQNPQGGSPLGPSLANLGSFTPPTAGNPLYYGLTGAFTGPQGPTDAALQPTVTASPIAQPTSSGLTFGDALYFMQPDAENIIQQQSNADMNWLTNHFGVDLSKPLDRNDKGWMQMMNYFRPGSTQTGDGGGNGGGGPEGGGAGSGGAP